MRMYVCMCIGMDGWMNGWIDEHIMYICVCVKLSQVKIFFNDRSSNKHFTCFFTSSHHNNKL